MKVWCNKCGVVESVEKTVTDEIGYEFNIQICPGCLNEAYREPASCVMCGEDTNPDNSICDCCKGSIRQNLSDLAYGLGISVNAAISGMAEYISMEA